MIGGQRKFSLVSKLSGHLEQKIRQKVVISNVEPPGHVVKD